MRVGIAADPTDILMYEGKLLPQVFRNKIVHCDAGPRVVRAYSSQPDGAGYKTEIKDILTTSDTWFRPSDVCVAPDGSLYVADWNDAGVGGHNTWPRKRSRAGGVIDRELIDQGLETGLVSTAPAEAVIVPL